MAAAAGLPGPAKAPLRSPRRTSRSKAKGIVVVLALAAVCKAALSLIARTGTLDVVVTAFGNAVRSGSAGFVAGTLQVVAFMWLRTVMNYQYKFGGSTREVLSKLYREGGVARLYRGLFPWAIFQAPLSRFGDVCANELIVGLASALLPQLPLGLVTFLGSMSGALWRVLITPIDTCKTIMQTDGDKGFEVLRAKVVQNGPLVLWSGWEGNYAANVIGNYPWFATMNMLQSVIPVPAGPLLRLVRSAACGAAASSVSDLCSNSVRVIKTRKQTHADGNITYLKAAKEVVAQDGLRGVFIRGLETRILTNVIQGAFFTVLWKYFAGTH